MWLFVEQVSEAIFKQLRRKNECKVFIPVRRKNEAPESFSKIFFASKVMLGNIQKNINKLSGEFGLFF